MFSQEFELWVNDNKKKIAVKAKKAGQESRAFCSFIDDNKKGAN